MELKSNNDNAKNSLDSEKSFFQKLEIEMKNIIFSVMYILLKDEEASIYTSILIAIINFLQLLYFPFHRFLKESWNYPSIADGISLVLGYFEISPYFFMANFNSYIIVFYVCVSLIMLTVLDIFFVNYSV